MKNLFPLFLLFSITAVFAQEDPDKNFTEAKSIIADLDSIVTPNGIQQDFIIKSGGENHWVSVRGQDKNNPIILFVHGGPASPITPLSWAFQRPLEEYFTMVNYDQRAAGKTYRINDTLNLGKTIHIEQYVEDAIDIADSIRKKYQKQKLILMGHSWGTIVAMKTALKRPDLFYAYVGIGQVINSQENERLSFQYGLQQAKKHNNLKAVEQLEAIAPYPGNDPLTRERIIIARKWSQYYGGLAAYRHTFDYYFTVPLLSPEYDSKDVEAIGEGSLFTLDRIIPEFLNVNFNPITEFPIPVIMCMGQHDYTTPTAPTKTWLENVKAPLKKGIWFEHASHLLFMEEPGKLLVTLVNEVRPLAVENKKGQ